MNSLSGVALVAVMVCGAAQAASKDVTMNLVSADGEPKAIGTVTISETQYGLLFTPKLTSLPPGVHGFHVHQNGSCDAAMKDGKKSGGAGGRRSLRPAENRQTSGAV